MKKNTNLAPLIFIFLIFIVSCKQNRKDKIVPETNQQKEALKESHKSIDGNVTLNNGQLWKANTETTTGIENMIERMASFTDKGNIEAYTTLKEGLEADFTELFQKCTMKGEAHHQLHNYLFPFIDLFDGLESSELDICKSSFKSLEAHLNTYSLYFE